MTASPDQSAPSARPIQVEISRRWIVLGVTAFLYPLCYLGWVLALVLVGLAEAARLFTERRIDWRPAALVTVGLAGGLLLHPNFPNIVEHAWVEISHTLIGAAWGSPDSHPIGGEFRPFSGGGTTVNFSGAARAKRSTGNSLPTVRPASKRFHVASPSSLRGSKR